MTRTRQLKVRIRSINRTEVDGHRQRGADGGAVDRNDIRPSSLRHGRTLSALISDRPALTANGQCVPFKAINTTMGLLWFVGQHQQTVNTHVHTTNGTSGSRSSGRAPLIRSYLIVCSLIVVRARWRVKRCYKCGIWCKNGQNEWMRSDRLFHQCT